MGRNTIRGCTAALTVLFAVMPAGTSTVGKLFAVTFQCTDPAGASIFTDSPSQLENCKPLTGTPGPGAGESTPPKVNSTAVPRKPDGALPSMPGAAVGGAASPIAVPVTRVGRSLVVHARLNGTRDARLIVDTGADVTVLSNEVARDLGLSGGASGVMLNTAGGSVRADMARVNSISVGNARVFNVAVAIHDLPDAASGVNGLLGLSFLDKFLVTLDMEKGELMLRPRE